MTLLYRIGAFFFYFGIAATILSIFMIATLYSLFASSGIPFPETLSAYARLISINSVAGALLGLVTGKVGDRILQYLGIMPNLFPAISTWMIITQFVPAYAGITSAVVMAIDLSPLPPVLKWGLTSTAWTIISASLLYFLLAKVGVAPVL